jgi:methylated-DNA-[protein]-cysteine S-methyltransferase
MQTLDFQSPLGIIEIIGDEQGIFSILFAEREYIQFPKKTDTFATLIECQQQLEEYFEGKRFSFTIPFIFKGTPFQQEVWQALTTVPYGKTASYKDIAILVGNEKAVRAIGTTNSKNLVSIIVPCHRIIGANGKLTGYAGGLWRKEWLLKHEQKYLSITNA